MKILHTSDWHLGKRLDDFPRMEEQKAVLQEIWDSKSHEKCQVGVVCFYRLNDLFFLGIKFK